MLLSIQVSFNWWEATPRPAPAAILPRSLAQMEAGVRADEEPERRGTPGSRIDPATALWLATAGAAEALDLPVRVGAFRRGYRFDAVAIRGRRPGSNLQLSAGGESPESVADQLQKILYHATRDDITSVWVDGLQVSGTLDSSQAATRPNSVVEVCSS